MGSDPKNWTPHEVNIVSELISTFLSLKLHQVGMWLDHVDFGDYSLRAVHSEMTGAELVTSDIDSIYEKLHVRSDDDKQLLLSTC